MHGMFQRVLFPTDFSEEAVAAIDRILSSSEIKIRELIVLHVIDSKMLEAIAEATRRSHRSEAQAREAAFSLLKGEAEEKLKSICERMGPYAEVVRAEVRVGRPSKEIVEAAEEHDVDLILIPSKSTVGIQSFVFGSVSLGVLEMSSKPVLVVKLPE